MQMDDVPKAQAMRFWRRFWSLKMFRDLENEEEVVVHFTFLSTICTARLGALGRVQASVT